jgi:hypothetical protein
MNNEMNKEQQELLDEAFNQFSKYKMENFDDTRWDVIIEMNISDNTKPYFVTGRPLLKEEFIEKCKTDSEFSQRWGLKIVSRKLTNPERYKLWFSNNYQTGMEYNESSMPDFSDSYYEPTPTKLITITYNDKIIESYE